jgi:hypothetical protein
MLGAVVGALALATFAVSFIAPRLLIPADHPLLIWVIVVGSVTASCAVGSAGGVVAARTCVSTGYLNLWYVRSTRAGLLGACALSTLGAATVGWLLLLVATVPAGADVLAVPLGPAGLVYVLVQLAAVALTYVCFFVLRPLLWRSPYALGQPPTR